MRTDRFELLIAHLENVVAKLPPQRFDITAWGQTLPSAASGPPLYERGPSCQTACCVMGHATDIPEFRADGLRLHWHGEWGSLFYYRPTAPGCRPTNSHGTWAAAEFMDIPVTHAEWLFHPDGYKERSGVSLETVIARLKRYVADGGTIPLDVKIPVPWL